MKEIVIKLDEKVVDLINGKISTLSVDLYTVLIDAVKNGNVLPPGHGRLIDADNIPIDTFFDEWDIPNAETLVEADKGE